MMTQTLTYRCPHCNTPVEVDPREGEELLVCPNEACGKPFQVSVPQAKPLPQAANFVAPAGPGNGTQPAAAQPAPMAVRAEEHETAGEMIRLEMCRRYPVRCLAYTLVTIVGLVGLVYGLTTNNYALAVISGIVAAVVAGRFFVWWLRMRTATLTLTNKRFYLQTGALQQETTEIAFKDVSDLQVHQNWFLRQLNVGDISLTVNTGEKRQILIMAVPNPEQVAERMRNPA